MHFDLDVISKALQTLLDATLPVLAGMAAFWLRAKYDEMRARLDEQKRFALDTTVRTAIYAAEQLKLSGIVESKLGYVTNLVEQRASDLGLSLSADEIRSLIEAAVKQNFGKFPEFGNPSQG
jgi:hypothetical protein